MPILDMYAQALNQLGRKQEFSRIGLQILSKITDQRRSSYISADEGPLPGVLGLSHYLQDVLDASRSVERSLSVPLHQHFGEIFLEPYITHYDGHDGFYMILELQNQMPERFMADEVRVKIISTNDEQPCAIWLTTEASGYLQPGTNQIMLHTTVCSGCYRAFSLHPANCIIDDLSRLVQLRENRCPISKYSLHLLHG